MLQLQDKDYLERCANNLEGLLEGNDVEPLKKAYEKLSEASHRLAEAVYAQASVEASKEEEKPKDGKGINVDFDEIQE